MSLPDHTHEAKLTILEHKIEAKYTILEHKLGTAISTLNTISENQESMREEFTQVKIAIATAQGTAKLSWLVLSGVGSVGVAIGGFLVKLLPASLFH